MPQSSISKIVARQHLYRMQCGTIVDVYGVQPASLHTQLYMCTRNRKCSVNLVGFYDRHVHLAFFTPLAIHRFYKSSGAALSMMHGVAFTRMSSCPRVGWCCLQQGTTAVPPMSTSLPTSSQKPVRMCAPSSAGALHPYLAHTSTCSPPCAFFSSLNHRFEEEILDLLDPSWCLNLPPGSRCGSYDIPATHGAWWWMDGVLNASHALCPLRLSWGGWD